MMDHQQFTNLLRQQAREIGSQKELAKQMGISQQYLSDVIKGRRMPNESVLKAMKLEFVLCYRKVYHKDDSDKDANREKYKMVAEDGSNQST